MQLICKGQSNFKKEMMLEEIESLNKKFPLENNQFDFKIIYIVENDMYYEVEFYFRNNLEFDLSLGEIPLHFIYDGAVIAIKVVNFKRVFGNIPSKSIVPCSFKIEKENVYYPEHINESELRLGINLEFKVEEVITENIVNMPEDLSYDQKKYFKEKIKEMPNLIKDTYNIYTLAIDKDEEGNVDIALLIRNGYENKISVKKMPLVLLNKSKIPVYFGIFESDKIVVEGRKSKIFLYKIPKSDLIKTYDSYKDFTVKINE